MGTKFTTQDFITKAKNVHGEKYDYSQTIYKSSRDKVMIICPKHGLFNQIASSHLSGNGCPKCAREWSNERKQHHMESARRSRGMTTEQWIERAKSVHGDKYDYSQTVYVNQRTDVAIICPKHGAFMQKADSHIRGCGCRLCGNESENHIGKHSWSEAQRNKIEATCLARYGAVRYLDSEEGRAKAAEIRSKPEFCAKMRNIIMSSEVQTKTRSTCIMKYGVSSAMSLPVTVDKMHMTKIKNHTWNTSKPEEKMYIMLCERFGDSDVIRQYKESRYPFCCDFYVKSLDLFIELNATWLHGKRWFDVSDSDCIAVLNEWQARLNNGHKFYQVAIDVWTVRDVKKREIALQNRLNYLAFWKNDLSDFVAWLDSENLVLNNILN